MFALESPSALRESLAPAYGTFDADDIDRLYDRRHYRSASSLLPLPTTSASPLTPRHVRGQTTYTATLRAIALTGVLVLAVSCVLITQQQSPAMPPRPLLLHHPHNHHTGAINNAISAAMSEAASAIRTHATSDLNRFEAQFITGINASMLRSYHHTYASTTSSHPVGSTQDYATAVYTAQQMQSFGINATIQTYYPLLSTPVHRRLAIVAPLAAAQELNLTEGAVPGDACTTDATALPPFLAYAATGNVTASVVYANYGRPEDFDWLAAQNVTLQNKIALVRCCRLSDCSRDIQTAEAHGVAGVLMYVDPHDDNDRSSITNCPMYPIALTATPGDPLTRGFAATKDAPRVAIDDVLTIPALPLSYRQARIILEALGGTTAPSEWQGGLMLKDDQSSGYRLGDDEVLILNLDLVMDNSVGPIWNVIGTIEGTEAPEQHVVIGSDRNGRSCGAGSASAAVVLEVARGFGDLLASGWRPQRTLVFGSWDSVFGSTEFVEDFAAELTAQAVAYIHVDAGTGSFDSIDTAPSIARFVAETAKAIPATLSRGEEAASSLYDQWTEQTTTSDAQLDDLVSSISTRSVATPFYQRLGIVSASVGFNAVDSVMRDEQSGNPQDTAMQTSAQWWGLMALRLVDATVLPFDYTSYRRIMLDALHAHEQRVDLAHARANSVDLRKLYAAIAAFGTSVEELQTQVVDFDTKSTSAMSETHRNTIAQRALNAKLMRVERHLLLAAGLPHRPWFKLVVFGPGFDESGSSAVFPGLDDAIAFIDNATTIQEHVNDITRVLTRAATALAKEA